MSQVSNKLFRNRISMRFINSKISLIWLQIDPFSMDPYCRSPSSDSRIYFYKDIRRRGLKGRTKTNFWNNPPSQGKTTGKNNIYREHRPLLKNPARNWRDTPPHPYLARRKVSKSSTFQKRNKISKLTRGCISISDRGGWEGGRK